MLVILAAVTISAVYDSGIIWQATNGTQNYVSAEKTENSIIGNTANIMQEYIDGTYSGGSDSGGDSGSGDTGMSSTELAAAIGSYVDYTPTTGTFDSSETYNGYSDQGFTTINGLNWRILFVDDSTLTLISSDVANTGFYLYSYDGYNNGVKLLNDACQAMYSNSSLSSTARSLNVDDIQNISSYNETTNTEYNKEYTASYLYYPNIFALETTGYVNSGYGDKYTRSVQDEYITGYSEASTLMGKHTSFNYTLSESYMDSIYYAMFTCQSGTSGSSSHKDYWLASRFTQGYGGEAFFRIGYVIEGDVGSAPVATSNSGGSAYNFALRPVVEIDLSTVSIGVTGSGESGDPYSITAK